MLFQTGEMWTVKEEGGNQYLHTAVYAIDEEWSPSYGTVIERDLAYRTSSKCPNIVDDLEERNVRQYLQPIPLSSVYPSYPGHLKLLATDTPLGDYYIKYPALANYYPEPALDGVIPDEIAQALLAEAMIFEILRNSPHPHVLQYEGCIVHDGRIVALALPKLPEALRERLQDTIRPVMTPVEAAKIYEEVSAAVHHIHSLGLAHNDINPSNIMLRDDGTAVVIDFDSCVEEGGKLRKGGTMGWWLEGFVSEKRRDIHALGLLKIYLEDPAHAEPRG
ncbi:hypothetical protein IFR05_004914 [Cadophora sp. M221]|nr:hypothetical protein IFR05_004914 [Cadophora sp. M221]